MPSRPALPLDGTQALEPWRQTLGGDRQARTVPSKSSQALLCPQLSWVVWAGTQLEGAPWSSVKPGGLRVTGPCPQPHPGCTNPMMCEPPGGGSPCRCPVLPGVRTSGASFLRESEVFRSCGLSARCTLQEARQGWLPCPEVRAFLVTWGLLQGAAASPPGAAGLPQGLSAARSLLERVGWGPCWCEHVREGVCVRASV